MIYLSLIARASRLLRRAERFFPEVRAVLAGKWFIFREKKVPDPRYSTSLQLLFRSAGVPDGTINRRTSSGFHGGAVACRKFGAGLVVDFKIDRGGVQESRVATTATMDRRSRDRTDGMEHHGAAGVFERQDDAIYKKEIITRHVYLVRVSTPSDQHSFLSDTLKKLITFV